jgi:hypothetical protein
MAEVRTAEAWRGPGSGTGGVAGPFWRGVATPGFGAAAWGGAVRRMLEGVDEGGSVCAAALGLILFLFVCLFASRNSALCVYTYHMCMSASAS